MKQKPKVVRAGAGSSVGRYHTCGWVVEDNVDLHWSTRENGAGLKLCCATCSLGIFQVVGCQNAGGICSDTHWPYNMLLMILLTYWPDNVVGDSYLLTRYVFGDSYLLIRYVIGDSPYLLIRYVIRDSSHLLTRSIIIRKSCYICLLSDVVHKSNNLKIMLLVNLVTNCPDIHKSVYLQTSYVIV